MLKEDYYHDFINKDVRTIMVLLLNENDLQWIKEYKNNIISSINNDTFYINLINEVFDNTKLLPEDIHTLIEKVKYFNESTVDQGAEYIAQSLNVDKKTAMDLLKDPKNAAKAFRAIREKLEECEDAENRATAENKGFLATVIYTLKKALHWLVKTFQDVKDYVLDTAISSRKEGEARAKRDFKWINKYNERRIDKLFSNNNNNNSYSDLSYLSS